MPSWGSAFPGESELPINPTSHTFLTHTNYPENFVENYSDSNYFENFVEN